MRVLAEEGVLLALGTVLAVMTGIRTDAVFIAGLLLAVSVTGLDEWLHADERWTWLPSVHAAGRLRSGAAGCRRAPVAAGNGRALAMGVAVCGAVVRPRVTCRCRGRSRRCQQPYAGAGSYVDRVARIRRGTVPRGFGWESTCAAAR